MNHCSLRKTPVVKRVAVAALAILLAACEGVPDAEPYTGTEIETQTSALSGSCVVSTIAIGAWYSQRDPRWSSILLGNSTWETIGSQGCLLTCLSMIYTDVWRIPTTPDQLNASAKASGCFAPGSALINQPCAINSRGGPHAMAAISSTSDVKTAICANYPVVVHVPGHYMLVYSYNGGDPSSVSSYNVVDPWTGQSKSLSGYTVLGWNKYY